MWGGGHSLAHAHRALSKGGIDPCPLPSFLDAVAFAEGTRFRGRKSAMSKYVNDMWPGSPQEKALSSPSDSGRSSHLSSRSRSRSSSRSSGPHSRSSSRSSSRSHSQPRRSRRSRSRSRRRHQRKYRRYSRSYSRSRSRSRGRHYYRDSGYGRPRRYYQSPSPYRSRSRSRSRGRSYHRRSYYAITRGRRYYGFGRTVYPEDRPRWRERSRTRSRSRSRTPFRLSEKGGSQCHLDVCALGSWELKSGRYHSATSPSPPSL